MDATPPSQSVPGRAQGRAQVPGQPPPAPPAGDGYTPPGHHTPGHHAPGDNPPPMGDGQMPPPMGAPGQPPPHGHVPPGIERPEHLPDGLIAAMKADPTHAPEHVALYAVERLGPEAKKWVADLRRQYPMGSPANLAILVKERFVRQARLSGGAAGLAGIVGAVADVGVLAWTQSRMVLHLAAVYGEDPTSRERAVELLVLTGVHKYTSVARTALDVAARNAPVSELKKHAGPGGNGQIYLKIGFALAKMAGMKAVKKMAAKVIPFAAVPFGAIANGGATKKLADRAMAMYGQRAWQRSLPGGHTTP